MFIPIGDDNSDRHTTPYVTYIFLAINVLVFILLQDMGRDIAFTFAYATVPAEILSGQDIITNPQMLEDPITGQMVEMPGLQPTPGSVYFTLITSMFMHGGFAHLFGNMMYLWVFGDNLENVMGHKRYLLFYLLCGVIASMAHVFASSYVNQNTLVPSLGASGAISGILGGYLLLFPTRTVRMWVLLGTIGVPAFITLGLWIVFQIVNGMGALGGQEGGGIAYAAHIGGFFAGMILVKFFVQKQQVVRQRKGFF